MPEVFPIIYGTAMASCLALSLSVDYLLVRSALGASAAEGFDIGARVLALALSLLVICKVAIWTM